MKERQRLIKKTEDEKVCLVEFLNNANGGKNSSPGENFCICHSFLLKTEYSQPNSNFEIHVCVIIIAT